MRSQGIFSRSLTIATAIFILAFAAAGSQAWARHPDAVEVFHCAFDDLQDKNFDRWPDRWERKRSPHHPPYLPIAITDDPQAVSGRALKIELDGGAAVLSSPPIRVDAQFSYVLEGRLKTHRLEHHRAWASVTFYDAERRPVNTIHSEKYQQAAQWTDLHLGPFTPQSDKIKTAVIQLHLEQETGMDLRGWVMFDDIWLGRLPRMTLSTNSQFNVYTDPDNVKVVCQLSGTTEREPEIRFELLDASGRQIDTMTKMVVVHQIDQRRIGRVAQRLSASDDSPVGYTGSVEWRPKLLSQGSADDAFGFYRIRATVRSAKGVVHQRATTIAVIRPFERPVQGEFGWSLPGGDRPLALDALVSLLPKVGINWLKFPVWYDDTNPSRGERLMRFAERLGSKGIEVVGMLDVPPESARSNFGDDAQLSIANIFASDPTLWRPSLDPVMTRLSLIIRWWQLGGDHDTSFVGYPDLAEAVVEIRKQLYRFGQEVQLGLGWQWLVETLPDDAPPWEFLTYSANPPLTPTEVSGYLERQPPGPAQRWVLVEPLPRSHYQVDARAQDLVEQMMAAKLQGAEGIFVPNPLSTEHGLMNDDGTPGELLMPWRTTALVLGGATHLGSMQLPAGSRNHIFTRGNEAVMVVWNEKPVEELVYLGDEIQQIDIWGRRVQTPAKPEDEHRQRIQVSSLPTFITGINKQVAQWRLAVQFDQTRMPSIFGKAHANGVQMKNSFSQGAGGEVILRTPKVWKVYPRRINFKTAIGEELSEPFEVELPFTASSGQQRIQLDFDVNVDRRYRFSVYRDLDIGLGDVTIDVQTKIDKHGHLIVEQRMTNHTDKLVDFKCFLYAPNRRRQRNQVFRLRRGDDVKRYRFSRGEELVGETLWLRAEELGGQRILNYRFVVTE